MRRVVAILVCASCFACNVFMTRHPPSYETSAVASCVVILAGQSTFHKTDFYKKGELVYANGKDGWGIHDLYELPDGTEVKLIDRSLAMACDGRGEPKFGYNYTTLERSADGGAYDPAVEFGVCATPASYMRTGLNIFVMDTGGTVYQADAAVIHPGLRKGDWVMPLSEYPSAADIKKRWIPVGY